MATIYLSQFVSYLFIVILPRDLYDSSYHKIQSMWAKIDCLEEPLYKHIDRYKHCGRACDYFGQTLVSFPCGISVIVPRNTDRSLNLTVIYLVNPSTILPMKFINEATCLHDQVVSPSPLKKEEFNNRQYNYCKKLGTLKPSI